MASPAGLPLLPVGLSRTTFESDYERVQVVKARRDRLDQVVAEAAGDSESTPIVRRLGCLRGITRYD